MMELQHVEHTLQPIWFAESKILILGTMPSPKSREKMFYYAHPQNRFWKALAGAFGEEIPQNDEARIAFLKKYKIALWDVLASCDIAGASDATIRNPVANDIGALLACSDIQKIYTTGTTAFNLYNKLIKPKIHIEARLLPSPSPANARISLEQLIKTYGQLLNFKQG